MKKLNLLVLPLLASCLLTGCNSGEEEGREMADIVIEGEKQEELYLDIFSQTQYTPNADYTFTVTFDDPTLVEYVNGALVTTNKTGSTIGHFVSAAISHDVNIHVSQSTVTPGLDLSYYEVSIFENSTFDVDVILTFNSIDVTNYIGEVKIVDEDKNGSSQISVNQTNSVLTIEGIGEGTAHYSVSTNFLGFTLSRQLSVTTKTK